MKLASNTFAILEDIVKTELPLAVGITDVRQKLQVVALRWWDRGGLCPRVDAGAARIQLAAFLGVPLSLNEPNIAYQLTTNRI